MSSRFADEKVQICTSFLQEHLSNHQFHQQRPLVVGLNGMQGVGKTTLVASLAESLNRNGIITVVFSIDDFYLTHEEQIKLAEENPDNALFQHRGQPGKHQSCAERESRADLLTYLQGLMMSN